MRWDGLFPSSLSLGCDDAKDSSAPAPSATVAAAVTTAKPAKPAKPLDAITAGDSAFDEAKAKELINKLGRKGSAEAEKALAAMGKDVLPVLVPYVLAQDKKVATVPKAKQYDAMQPVLRAIVVFKRIGKPALAGLALLNKLTKDEGVRTYSCIELRRLKAKCPGGDR